METCIKICLFMMAISHRCYAGIPLVVNTWNFQNATQKAWEVLKQGSSNSDNALEALTLGCKSCQDEQCDHTVGFGGSPDENGETTLDALIFDGDTMDMGAIGGIRRVKNVMAVARHVLENTEHSLLVGNLASEFAFNLCFPDESLQTNFSLSLWENWKANNCQPNFWKNVSPDPKLQCGPYKIQSTLYEVPSNVRLQNEISTDSKFNDGNHDTIGMIVISENGHVVAGTSTNGASYKIPGRVGDAAIPGAGAYANSEFGAAVATGDGDIMMRFLPSFLAVEQLRLGASPTKAAKIAIARIATKFPTFFGGIVVADKKGVIGAACNGMDQFPFTVASEDYPDSIIKYVSCADNSDKKIKRIPLVVHTWNYPNASQKAWEVLTDNSTGSDNALDALTLGCNVCDHAGCGVGCGFGGTPDENGETTLDALIYDGDTMNMGAIGGLRRVKDAIGLARMVLDYTEHSFIVGDLATEFAKIFNFTEESLQTNYSLDVWKNWTTGKCQPNFWKNVDPEPSHSCGPYAVPTTPLESVVSIPTKINSENHDTIGMIVISESGHVVAGTTTNGLSHKIPGRLGDSPIVGAGAYANSEYGAAVATGDGDIMMRFLPSFLAVEQLSIGATPFQAANIAISRIAAKYPSFRGAVIVADKDGNVATACHGMNMFEYIVVNNEFPGGELRYSTCTGFDTNSDNSFAAISVGFYTPLTLLVVCYL